MAFCLTAEGKECDLLCVLGRFLASRLGLGRCTGVESVEAGILVSKKVAFKVTNPAVRPSGFGDSNFSLILGLFLRSDTEVREVPKRVLVEVYFSLMS